MNTLKIRPDEGQKDYAAILKSVLHYANSIGLRRIMSTCNKHNEASQKSSSIAALRRKDCCLAAGPAGTIAANLIHLYLQVFIELLRCHGIDDNHDTKQHLYISDHGADLC